MSDGQGNIEKKKVDEDWKSAAADEKSAKDTVGSEQAYPEVTFTMFISGLMMEGLIALGETEHPVSKKKELNKPHAQFIIETLSVINDKTKNNLTPDETATLEAILYELRMRYIAKTSSADKKASAAP